MVAIRNLLLLLLILVAQACASREAFQKRMGALVQARDRAEAAANPSRRTWLDDVRFPPSALEATVLSEIDAVGEDGLRRTLLTKERVRYAIDGETGSISLEDAERGETVILAEGEAVYLDRSRVAGVDSTVQVPALEIQNHLIRGAWPGSGAAAIDYDRDGWMDLFAGDGRRSILYRNAGGQAFEDRTAEAGLPDLSVDGVLAFDYDGDGWTDIYVTSYFGPDRLFRNREGRFQDVSGPAGIGKVRKGTSAAAADIDGDGDLDLYALQSGDYFSRVPKPPWGGTNGNPNVLYRNEGDGTFTDVGEEAGIDSTGWSLACAFGDLDDDGDPDLYIANDFGPNQYFVNLGNGTFEDRTVEAGAEDNGYGMGVSLGDYDGDGRLDVYVSNMITSYPPVVYHDPDLPLPLMGRIFRSRVIRWFEGTVRGNTLLRNLGENRFEEAPRETGPTDGGWCWAGSFYDFDNDGDLDVYAPNGFMPGEGTDSDLEFWIDSISRWEEYEDGTHAFDPGGRPLRGADRNRLFRQEPDGTFRDIGFVAGAGLTACVRGLVIADFDNDGDLDLYCRNYGAPSALLCYGGDRGGYLQVELAGEGKNPAGIGARVTLQAGGKRQVREVAVGQSYLSHHSPILHFGLGDADRIDILEIRWPDGTIQEIRDVPANRRMTLSRPGQTDLEK